MRGVWFFSLASLVSLSLVAVACTASPSADPSPGGSAAGPSAGGGGGGGARGKVSEDGLGPSCTLGGSPGHVSAKDDATCAQGVCVYDGAHALTQEKTGQTYYDTYCSADCSAADCPTGWDCAVADGRRSVCVKQPAVCGDGVRQYGEACDDGNVSALDGCNADCTAVLPSSLNVIELEANREKTKRWFPKLPYDYERNLAVIEEVTPERVALRFAVAPVPYVFVLRIPRKVGVVDPASPTASGIGWLANVNGAETDLFGTTKRTEVVAIGADKRSYRVRYEATGGALSVRGELVVTVPSGALGYAPIKARSRRRSARRTSPRRR